MMTDLLAGQVQVAFDVMVTSLPHVRTGVLRALAVAGIQRFDMLPEVPTIAETLAGYDARTRAAVGEPILPPGVRPPAPWHGVHWHEVLTRIRATSSKA